MKIIEILFAFLATQGKSLFQTNTEALSRRMVSNARSVATLLTILVISITLFCSGVSMAYGAVVAGLSQGDGWICSPGLIAGLIMTLASFAGLLYSLGEKRWLNATGIPTEASEVRNEGPGLDTAFAFLISEVAMHLKESRKHDQTNPGDTPQV
ncbi:MAG: hypothetical protein ABIR96_04425 [Bdellovibrionota bacterium]